MDGFLVAYTIILLIGIPLWQARYRKEFLKVLEEKAPEHRLKFAGRIGWNGFYGRFRTGNEEVDKIYRQLRNLIVALRAGGIGLFFLMVFVLANCVPKP